MTIQIGLLRINKYINTMKTIINIFIIPLAAVAFLSCQKSGNDLTTYRPIQFQAISGDAGTRTTFSGFYVEALVPGAIDFDHWPEGYFGNNLAYAFERIDWTDGDKFEVYSPESGSSAVYTVSSHLEDGAYSVADAVSSSPLFWEGDGTHTFYAYYPAPGSVPGSNTNMDRNIVSGTIPSVQALKQDPEDSRRFHAEMDKYGYMYSVTSAAPDNTYDRTTLSFKPLMSCIEVLLIALEEGDESTWPTVTKVELVSSQSDAYLAGDFTTELNPDGTFRPLLNSDVTNGQNTVSFDVPGGGVQLRLWSRGYTHYPTAEPTDFWYHPLGNHDLAMFSFLVLPMEQTNLKLRLTLASGKVVSTEIKQNDLRGYKNALDESEEWYQVEDQGYLKVSPGSKFWIAAQVPNFN